MPVSLSTILFKTKHLSNIRFDLLLPSDFVQLSDDAQRLDLDLDLVWTHHLTADVSSNHWFAYGQLHKAENVAVAGST